MDVGGVYGRVWVLFNYIFAKLAKFMTDRISSDSKLLGTKWPHTYFNELEIGSAIPELAVVIGPV